MVGQRHRRYVLSRNSDRNGDAPLVITKRTGNLLLSTYVYTRVRSQKHDWMYNGENDASYMYIWCAAARIIARVFSPYGIKMDINLNLIHTNVTVFP